MEANFDNWKNPEEMKNLVSRLSCRVNDNDKRIIIDFLFSELFYSVKRYKVVSMTDEEYSHYYNLLNSELEA